MTPQAGAAAYWPMDILMRTKFLGVSIDGVGRAFSQNGDLPKFIIPEEVCRRFVWDLVIFRIVVVCLFLFSCFSTFILLYLSLPEDCYNRPSVTVLFTMECSWLTFDPLLCSSAICSLHNLIVQIKSLQTERFSFKLSVIFFSFNCKW